MALEIKILDYGDIELEASFLVLGHDCGRIKRVPVYGFLITGGKYPVVVDTGYRDNAIMESLGMRGLQFHDNMIENQLARHGLKVGDVRCVLHTPDALRFLDLEIAGGEEIMPGVWCEAANAHTEGSMNVMVDTADGIACICGDVIYNFNDQIVTQFRQTQFMEPQVTGNHAGSKRAEKGAIKKLLNNYRFLLAVHDKPARIQGQRVVGRLEMQVPGPIVESVPRRDWFPM
jgi:hypothetical protein